MKTAKSVMRASDHPPARHFNLHLYTFSLIDRAASEDPATSCPVVTTEPHDGKLAETISHAMQNVLVQWLLTILRGHETTRCPVSSQGCP